MSVSPTRELVLLSEVRQLAAAGAITEIREKAGLSQSEIARAIGVSQAALSRWESGARRPRGKPAVALALLLRKLAQSGVP